MLHTEAVILLILLAYDCYLFSNCLTAEGNVTSQNFVHTLNCRQDTIVFQHTESYLCRRFQTNISKSLHLHTQWSSYIEPCVI